MGSTSMVHSESMRLFEKLSVLPLSKIAKHLNASAIIFASMHSEKMERLVTNCCKPRQKTAVLGITITEDKVLLQLIFKDMNTAQSFQICCKRELDCVIAFQKISQFFPPASYANITLSLGSRCPDFPFRFLSRLPRGTADLICLHADREVNGADLIKFLENVRVKDGWNWYLVNRLDIQVNIKHFVMSDQLCLENRDIKIRDARFLTHQAIPRIGFVRAEIGLNNYTSQDLNVLLKSHMAESFKNFSFSALFTIEIREDQRIKLEEVMEGFDAHVGKPRIRDRWQIDWPNGSLSPTAIDLNEGLDIANSRNTLATVLLEPNRFTFVTWVVPFFWTVLESEMRTKVANHKEEIARVQTTLDTLIEQIAERGENWSAEDLSAMIGCRDEIVNYTNRLANSSEIYHKLIHEWNND